MHRSYLPLEKKGVILLFDGLGGTDFFFVGDFCAYFEHLQYFRIEEVYVPVESLSFDSWAEEKNDVRHKHRFDGCKCHLLLMTMRRGAGQILSCQHWKV